MAEVLVCVVIVLAIIYIMGPSVVCGGDGSFKDPNVGYAVGAPVSKEEQPHDYNNYLQSVALDSTIQNQHNEWVNDLMVNYQPRMYSVRDDCDDGETKRWGLLKKDYGNVINENQNISVPSGRTCTEGDGGNSRWGGYGIGLCPVQRP